MTVVTSLNAQQRPVLDFLSQTYRAARLAEAAPALLPEAEAHPPALVGT